MRIYGDLPPFMDNLEYAVVVLLLIVAGLIILLAVVLWDANRRLAMLRLALREQHRREIEAWKSFKGHWK